MTLETVASEKETALYKALVAAQAEMPTIAKDSEAKIQTKAGGEYRYKYLSLATLLEAVLPVLNKHGLALIQSPNVEPGLETIIVHEAGGTLSFRMLLPVDAHADAKALGSAITYARRYALLSVLALAPDEDDDGTAAAAQPRAQARPAATEKFADKGLMDEVGLRVTILQDAYPEAATEGKTWKQTAWKYAGEKLGVKPGVQFTVQQANDLRGWLEEQFRQLEMADQVPSDADPAPEIPESAFVAPDIPLED